MSISFTERQLDIMAVLWEFGPSTAAEVRQRLSDERLLMFDAALTRATIIADSAGTTGLKVRCNRVTDHSLHRRLHPLSGSRRTGTRGARPPGEGAEVNF